MKNMMQYKKSKIDPHSKMITTGVSIEGRQKEFIDDNNLNLSEITRDAINDLMNGTKKESVSRRDKIT